MDLVSAILGLWGGLRHYVPEQWIDELLGCYALRKKAILVEWVEAKVCVFAIRPISTPHARIHPLREICSK
jgi:hypothetical protein